MPAGPPLIADWAVTAYAEARMSKQKASKGRPSPAKAREILHDGTVHGKSITAKQRRFMGAVVSRAKDKS